MEIGIEGSTVVNAPGELLGEIGNYIVASQEMYSVDSDCWYGK